MAQMRTFTKSRRSARNGGRGRNGLNCSVLRRVETRESLTMAAQRKVAYEYDVQESDAAIRTLERLKAVIAE